MKNTTRQPNIVERTLGPGAVLQALISAEFIVRLNRTSLAVLVNAQDTLQAVVTIIDPEDYVVDMSSYDLPDHVSAVVRMLNQQAQCQVAFMRQLDSLTLHRLDKIGDSATCVEIELSWQAGQ